MSLSRRAFVVLIAALAAAAPQARVQSAEPATEGKIRVACIGASITFGANINNREANCYPAQMQKLLGAGYDVRNYGVNASTMLKRGDTPYWKEMWGINDPVISSGQIPILRQVAFETGTEIIDQHTAFLGKQAWFPDNIHPNAEGAAAMAKLIGAVVGLRRDAAGFDFEKSLAAQGIEAKATSFFGYRQLEFKMDDGRQCTVVRPYVTAASRAYAWRGEYFGHEPQTDLALLERGFHVVYVNCQGMQGPPAMVAWEKFHGLLQKLGLTGRMTLLGMSRGGYFAYHWATLHPETVAVIYGDNPVSDFAVDKLEPLVKAKVAIIHVIGTADTASPPAKQTYPLQKRYLELGGTVVVIEKPGVEHHPHSLPNPEPIVSFILSHQE
jgi:hypothetical protein